MWNKLLAGSSCYSVCDCNQAFTSLHALTLICLLLQMSPDKSTPYLPSGTYIALAVVINAVDILAMIHGFNYDHWFY